MLRLLPPLCWTGLIAWLGSGYWTPGRSGAFTDVLLDGAAVSVVLMASWPSRFGRGVAS